MEEKRGKQDGQKEEQSGDAVSVKALAYSMWSSEVEMTPQNCFQQKREARLIGLRYQLPNAGYPGKAPWPWPRWHSRRGSSAEG